MTEVHGPAPESGRAPLPAAQVRRVSGGTRSGAAVGAGGRARSVAVELVLLVGLAAVIAVGLRSFVAQAFSIPSASMFPQLAVGDRVVVSKVAFKLHDPNRGDIVVFDCPPRVGCPSGGDQGLTPGRVVHGALEAVGLRQPSTEEYIKRVVGLPGETVEAHDGTVFVDGRRLVEPYLAAAVATSDFGPITVGDGELWVMGDNRANSSDSRVFGPIHADTVVGRATHRVWPPTRTAFL